MIKSRTIVISLAALIVTACADASFQNSATTRFDSAPLVSYAAPDEQSTLSEENIEQAATLASAKRQLKADALEEAAEEPAQAISARSSVSLL